MYLPIMQFRIIVGGCVNKNAKWMLIWFIFVGLVQIGIVVHQTATLNKLIEEVSTTLLQVEAHERCLLNELGYVPACRSI